MNDNLHNNVKNAATILLYSVANAAFSLIQQKMMYSKYGASDFKAPGDG